MTSDNSTAAKVIGDKGQEGLKNLKSAAKEIGSALGSFGQNLFGKEKKADELDEEASPEMDNNG